jgi:hypothetical protein
MSFLFETCSPVRDEELSVLILRICARLTEASRMDTFEAFVPSLRMMLGSDQPKLAVTAAHVCRNLAERRPGTISTIVPLLTDLSRSRSDLGSVCSAAIAALKGTDQAKR